MKNPPSTQTDMPTLSQQEFRKKEFASMKEKLEEIRPKEEGMFYLHSSEDRIVLSHALFWVMSRAVADKFRKAKFFLLLRQYEEEMLTAYLTEDESFPDLLDYCNTIMELLPVILGGAYHLSTNKDAQRLGAIVTVAAGYGGDMSEELCDELLDDMDFFFETPKCRKIELLLPELYTKVDIELAIMKSEFVRR